MQTTHNDVKSAPARPGEIACGDDKSPPHGTRTKKVPPPPSSRTRLPWGIVALLTAVGILNYVDRVLPSILAEALKTDLQLSDTTIGIINGFGFLLIYAVAGIPIARFADKGQYGKVIAISLGFWSLMTALGGMARTGLELAATRMGVALGEAGSSPAAHAFISRNFPANKRALALSVVTLSAPLGAMIGFMGGGYLGQLLGWRTTFLVMGLAGLALTPIVLIVFRKRKTQLESGAAVVARSSARVLPMFRKPSLWLLLAGSSFIAIGSYAATAFAPALLIREHGMSLSEAGVQLGILSGVIGVVALLVTGALADKLSTRDPRWSVGVIIAMILIGLPFSVAAFSLADARSVVLLLAINYAIPIAYLAPTVAAVHRLVPLTLRARFSAILLFCSALFGGLGPLFTGMVSDAIGAAGHPGGLGQALLIVVPSTFLIGAILYGVALIPFRADTVNDEGVAG